VILDGEIFVAGDVPPEHVARRIRNPQCWTELAAPVDEGTPPVPGPPAAPPLPTEVVAADPAGPGGINPLEAPADDTTSSAVPTADGVPAGGPTATNETGNAQGQPLAEPPRSGKGSSEAAWRAFAAQYDVNTDGMDRGDIIAALRDDGFIQ
jgi:hypothetical protein